MTNTQKNIFLLRRLPIIGLILFVMTVFALVPSVNVKCRRNAAKVAVCEVTESRLWLQTKKRDFYPISVTYRTARSTKVSINDSHQMIFLDASAQQLPVGASSKDVGRIWRAVDEASAFLAAKSQSYESQPDHLAETLRWLLVGVMGLTLLLIVKNLRQTLTSRDAV
jgi:hypothetical protein